MENEKVISKKIKKERSSLDFKTIFKSICICVFFLIATFLFLFHSPSHILVNSETRTDSSVFREVAFEMSDGAVPYKDTFDHKGPLIYIINYIAFIINPQNGLFYVEMLTTFIIFILLYKIARLKCNRFFSIVASLIAFSPLFSFFEGGNLTEEYSLLFILAGLFIFLDFLLNDKISKARLILCGLSLGSVLMLRMNLIAMWIIFCIFVLIRCITKKQFKELGTFILYFVIGLLIIIIPFIIWFAVTGALKDFWNAYILFNFKYSSANPIDRPIPFFFFSSTPLFIITSIVLIYDFKCRKDPLNIFCLAYLVLDLLFASISGEQYNHYAIAIIASIIFPISILLSLCQELEKKNKSNEAVTLIILIYLLTTFVIPDWYDLFLDISLKRSEAAESTNSWPIIDNNIKRIVSENTSSTDKISVIGNWDLIYLHTERHSATKYSYQYPIGEVDTNILDEYFEELSKELPKIIIQRVPPHTELANRCNSFFKQNAYNMVYEEQNCFVYLKE